MTSGLLKKSLKKIDDPEWVEEIIAPGSKFEICADKATHRSKGKDLSEVLAKRARRHSTAVELDDRIAIQKDSNMGESKAMTNEKGERRRNIDDI